jgi:hypothetical protein
LLDDENIGRHGVSEVSTNVTDAADRRSTRRLAVLANYDERRADGFDVAAD